MTIICLLEQMMDEKNMEDVKMLEAQVEDLQATVSALQDQLKEKQKNMAFNLGDHMQTAMSVFIFNSGFIFFIINLVFLTNLPCLLLDSHRKSCLIFSQILHKREEKGEGGVCF